MPLVRTADTRLQCQDSEYHDPTATGNPGEIRVLYVAGPMSGYRDNNHPAFNAAADRLRAACWQVVNPATDVAGNERHYVDFIREDLRLMLDCDGVAMLDNWWESTGARNEVQVAGLLKMPCRTVEDWLRLADAAWPNNPTTTKEA